MFPQLSSVQLVRQHWLADHRRHSSTGQNWIQIWIVTQKQPKEKRNWPGNKWPKIVWNGVNEKLLELIIIISTLINAIRCVCVSNIY